MVVAYAYSPKYNYIIGWNAKSGCSSFRDLFLYLHKDEVNKITNGRHNLQFDFPLPKNVNDIPIFVLVRNPYSRMVSCFTNKYCSTPQHALLRNKMKVEPCNYVNFLKQLQNIKNNNNLNNFDVHVQEQTFNLLPNANILKLENYKEDIINMYNHKNLISLLPKVKEYLNNQPLINETVKFETDKILHQHIFELNSTKFPNWQNFYGPGPIVKNHVFSLYTKDFLKFNYPKNFYSVIFDKII